MSRAQKLYNVFEWEENNIFFLVIDWGNFEWEKGKN